jgi:hypothetical protein
MNDCLYLNIGDSSDLTLNTKAFVFEHASDNIREDYLIGKVLGTGKTKFTNQSTYRGLW